MLKSLQRGQRGGGGPLPPPGSAHDPPIVATGSPVTGGCSSAGWAPGATAGGGTEARKMNKIPSGLSKCLPRAGKGWAVKVTTTDKTGHAHSL